MVITWCPQHALILYSIIPQDSNVVAVKLEYRSMNKVRRLCFTSHTLVFALVLHSSDLKTVRNYTFVLVYSLCVHQTFGILSPSNYNHSPFFDSYSWVCLTSLWLVVPPQFDFFELVSYCIKQLNCAQNFIRVWVEPAIEEDSVHLVHYWVIYLATRRKVLLC